MNVSPTANLISALSRLPESGKAEVSAASLRARAAKAAQFNALVDEARPAKPAANEPARKASPARNETKAPASQKPHLPSDFLLRREAPAAGAKPQSTRPGQIIDIKV